MRFATLGKGPEQVFIVVRNDDGADIGAGVPLEWKADGTRDGIDVQAFQTAAKQSLFVGVNHYAFSDGEYGLAQVYGYDDDALVLKHGIATNSNVAIGDVAIPNTNGQFEFVVAGTQVTDNHTTTVGVVCYDKMVAAMQTLASASNATITGTCGVFLRCM